MTPATKASKAAKASKASTTQTAKRTPGGSAVRAYLEALSTPLPRGRAVDVEALRVKLSATAEPVEKLRLIQRIYDAEHRVSASDRAKLEEAFVAVAAVWGAANKITWAAWRELGVPADVLRKAKISR